MGLILQVILPEKHDSISYFTVSTSLAGLPAISMPCGEVENLSVGLQIIGKNFKESEIFKMGTFFEKIITNN